MEIKLKNIDLHIGIARKRVEEKYQRITELTTELHQHRNNIKDKNSTQNQLQQEIDLDDGMQADEDIEKASSAFSE